MEDVISFNFELLFVISYYFISSQKHVCGIHFLFLLLETLRGFFRDI